MSGMFFAAITATGLRPLPIPPSAHTFTDLLAGLPVGVYSAWRTFSHNKFLYLQAHLERTQQSMDLLGWGEVLAKEAVCRALQEAATAVPWPDSRVRLDVLAHPAPQQLGTDSRLLLALIPLIPPAAELYETGVAVALAEGLTRENPLVKTADFSLRRVQYQQNHQTHQGEDVYEYLLTSPDGYLLEGAQTNFWGVRHGVLYTAATGILEGITRKILLQLAPQVGIPVQLQPIHRQEIAQLEEAALSGSSRAFLPVVRIQDQVVGNGRPGPISRRLLTAYNDFLRREIRPAI